MFRGQTSCQSCGKGLSTWVGAPLAAADPLNPHAPATPPASGESAQAVPTAPMPDASAAAAVLSTPASVPASGSLFESFKLPAPTMLASVSLLNTQSAPVATPVPDRMLPAGATVAPASHAPVAAPAFTDRSALNDDVAGLGWPTQVPGAVAPPPHATARRRGGTPPRPAGPHSAPPAQPAGVNPMQSGGRTWDPDTGTWWSSAPNSRPPRRRNQSQRAASNSGCAVLVVIAFAILLIGSVASSGTGQATSNDYPYATPYIVFGDNNGGDWTIAPATAVSQDQPDPSFVPATVPSVDPLVPTGGMVQARADHTATLLADGRVLIAGGTDGTAPLATAEIFDPTRGRFTKTGPMMDGRRFHTAAILPDGRVLVAGGVGAHNKTLAAAEIFDPATGKFAATGPRAPPRQGAAAVSLADGKILVIGGYDGTKQLTSAEVYDPAAGTFSPTGSLVEPR